MSQEYKITQQSLIDFLQSKGIEGPYYLSNLGIVSAQYIADFEDDSYADDVIAKYTRLFNKGLPNHSHSEIGFWIYGAKGEAFLVFYSSTSRSYRAAWR